MLPYSKLYKEVGTKDSIVSVPKFNRSASKWTKADLFLLGVDYQYRCFDDIHIGIKDADVPPELLASNNLSTVGLID